MRFFALLGSTARPRRSYRAFCGGQRRPKLCQSLGVEGLEGKTLLSANAYTFAVIGDYGADAIGGAANEKAVADLVLQWKPDDIITVGDNNYNDGGSSTIEQNIGQYYGSYIYPHPSSAVESNHFWPATGNHEYKNDGDTQDPTPKPFVDYFQWLTTVGDAAQIANVTPPRVLNVAKAVPNQSDNNPDNNGLYYSYGAGDNGTGGPLVQFVVLDTEIWVHKVQLLVAQGITNGSDVERAIEQTPQAQWLRLLLSESRATWNIVVGHHPAYTNATSSQDTYWNSSDPKDNNYAGNNPWMQLPYKSWGADALLTGHVHAYNRLMVDDFLYIVNGAGGAGGPDLTFDGNGNRGTQPGTAAKFSGSIYGAMLCTADVSSITFKFMSTDAKSVDEYTLRKQNSASVVGSELIVTGSNARDVIFVLPSAWTTARQRVFSAVRVLINGRSMGTFSGIDHISVYGLNGHDRIRASKVGISLTIDGGGGHDLIVGGRRRDVLFGGLGNDWLIGYRNDQMLGGRGRNRVIRLSRP